MLGKLPFRQAENTAFCAFHWKSSLFKLAVETLIGIAVVKQILILDLNTEHEI